MCGRYYVDEQTRRLMSGFSGGREILREMSAGDVRPSEQGVVLVRERGRIRAERMGWGFFQPEKNGLLINARAETAFVRPAFRDSAARQRCAVPAAGFYEWNKEGEKASFFRKDEPAIFLGGLYRRFEEGKRYVILTVPANDSVAPVHDRMPVLVGRDELEAWLGDEAFGRMMMERIPPALEREQAYEQQRLPFL